MGDPGCEKLVGAWPSNPTQKCNSFAPETVDDAEREPGDTDWTEGPETAGDDAREIGNNNWGGDPGTAGDDTYYYLWTGIHR